MSNKLLIEQTIDDILNSIKPTQYKALKDIVKRRNIVLEALFEKFKHYEYNIQIKDSLCEELEQYEYISVEELQPEMSIKYIDLYNFFKLSLRKTYKIFEIKKKKIKLRNRLYDININKKIFFRKLSNETLVKMKLMEYMD